MSIDYVPLTLDIEKWKKKRKDHDAITKAVESWYDSNILGRFPQMEFYLDRLFMAIQREDPTEILTNWETSAPRPVQRMLALGYYGHECGGLILYGQLTGTGKTTVAYEVLWRAYNRFGNGVALPPESELGGDPSLAFTGLEFTRKAAELAKENKVGPWVDELCEAHILLLDDLDKPSGSDGKFSATVQQTLYDVIERHTTRSGYGRIIITLNSSGDSFLAKFDDRLRPYLQRRLRERFRAIDFDPVNADASDIDIEE